MSSTITSRDRYLAAAVREAEAHPTVAPCQACGGNGLDRDRDVDGEPLPCRWCGGDGLETSLVVEGQVAG